MIRRSQESQQLATLPRRPSPPPPSQRPSNAVNNGHNVTTATIPANPTPNVNAGVTATDPTQPTRSAMQQAPAPSPQFSSGSNTNRAVTNYLPPLNEVTSGGATLFANSGNYGSNRVSNRIGGITDRYAPYSVGQPSYYFC
jgi:hypothetical protein